MIPTARQSVKRLAASTFPAAAASSCSQALPAESSRQALLRSVIARKVHLDSTAVDKRDGPGDSVHTPGVGLSGAAGAHPTVADGEFPAPRRLIGVKPKGPKQVKPPPPPPTHLPPDLLPARPSVTAPSRRRELLDSWLHTQDPASLPPSPLPQLETFRGLIDTHPVLALLTLAKIPPADLYLIRHEETKALMYGALRATRETPAIVLRLDPEESAKALRVFRAVLHSLPSVKGSPDAYMGNYLAGRTLRKLLMLCVSLKCPRLAKSIFQDRLREQLATEGEQPALLDFQGIARDFAEAREWTSVVELFSPETFPHRYYTPEILALYMRAHFGIHQGSKVPRLFELHEMLDLTPTAEAINHLIQAFLEMGELGTARQLVEEAKVRAGRDLATQQLAILRGYKALGYDGDLEKKVLADVAKLKLPLEGKLVNSLVQMRMAAGDMRGAERMLRRFDLKEWGWEVERGSVSLSVGQGEVKPTEGTVQMLFGIIVHKGNMAQIKALWTRMCEEPALVTDAMVATLLRALITAGKLDEADGLLRSAITAKPDAPAQDGTVAEWTLPTGVKPGVKSLNFYLGEVSRVSGLAGMERAMLLLHSLQVKPNNFTLKIIIDFARTSLQHKPGDLAALVTRILEVSPEVEPGQAVLDSLLADAVRSATPPRMRMRKPTSPLPASSFISSKYPARPTSTDTYHPTAGLVLSPHLQRALSSIIDSLESAQSNSTSRTLSSRLRFDAMTAATTSGVPSARIVWNSLLSRGYNPDHRHLTALMQGYADAGHMYEAQDLLAFAKSRSLGVSRGMLMVLITGWGQLRRPKIARKAYEQLKDLGKRGPVSPGTEPGLDLPAVTAMIQVLTLSGHRHDAARLVRNDLPPFIPTLDSSATVVAAQALRNVGDLRGALELVDGYAKRTPGSLPAVQRKIVRGVRQWARKNLARGGLAAAEQVDSAEIVQMVDVMLGEAEEGVTKGGVRKWMRLGRRVRGRLERAWSGTGARRRREMGGEGEGQLGDLLGPRERWSGRRVIVGKGEGTGKAAAEARRARLRVRRMKRSRAEVTVTGVDEGEGAGSTAA
ncbi:hypothetical protein IAT38_003870 [Cryptococcus sp. DSM 104549]